MQFLIEFSPFRLRLTDRRAKDKYKRRIPIVSRASTANKIIYLGIGDPSGEPVPSASFVPNSKFETELTPARRLPHASLFRRQTSRAADHLEPVLAGMAVDGGDNRDRGNGNRAVRVGRCDGGRGGGLVRGPEEQGRRVLPRGRRTERSVERECRRGRGRGPNIRVRTG